MVRAVKRSWSRWRPSLSLETWCLWPAFSSRAPTETPCSSASKMPRYTSCDHITATSCEWKALMKSVFVFLPALRCGVWSRHAWSQDAVAALLRGAGAESVYWVYEDVLSCWSAEQGCVLMALCCVCLDGFRKGLFRMCTSPWCVWIRRTAALSCWCTAPVWWFCPSGGTRWPMNRKASWERGMSKYFLLFCRHDLLLLQCFCHLFDRK